MGEARFSLGRNGLLRRQVFPAIANLDYGAIALVLLIKVFIIGFGVLSYQIWTDHAISTWQQGLAIWNQWDAPHYLDIAQNGYQATGENRVFLAFYPLFPLLVCLLETFSQDYLHSAFWVSGIASIATCILLQRLIELDEPRNIAQAAVWFLLIFPTSYFLHIGYTESLFMALALGCLLAARQQNWWLAGLLGALASFSRVSGIVLIPTLAVEALLQYREHQKLRADYWWIALVPVGFLGYLGCNAYVTGNPFAFLQFQREYWYKFLTFPWVGFADKLMRMSQVYSPWKVQMVGVQEILFTGLGLVTAIWSWFKLRPSYTVWVIGNLLLFTSTSHILSVPRYVLILFPMYLLFAKLSKHQLWFTAITVWSLLFLSLFISLFVQGRWAF